MSTLTTRKIWTGVILVFTAGYAADAIVCLASNHRDTTPACQTDEITATHCRWDAAHQGNGRGRSFTTYPRPDGTITVVYDDGTVRYVRESTRSRMSTARVA